MSIVKIAIISTRTLYVMLFYLIIFIIIKVLSQQYLESLTSVLCSFIKNKINYMMMTHMIIYTIIIT